MATLAEIRAKLQQQDTRQSNSGGGGDNAIYRHWDIPEGSSAKIRFLPDADESNTFFWIERAMIKLPFSGVVGQTDSKPFTVQIPCMEMWGETCPILTEVRPWFKDPSLEDMGRKYWKKRSYLFQGFVRETPFNEESVPENPIRRFVISPQIFNVIKAALMDAEIEEIPTDYQQGLDFIITKTSKGGYSDYSTSKWSRKESALTNEEHAAIENYGLYDLKEFLPKKPTEVELKVIKEMFEASVDGQAYDPELWGQYFKPYGLDIPNSDSNGGQSKNASKPAPAVAESEDTPPFDKDEPAAPASDTSSSKTADILAMIRARQSS